MPSFVSPVLISTGPGIPSRALLLLAVALLGLPVASAQTPGTGAISGVISDPAHKRIPHVEVDAANHATGLHRETTTGQEGVFRLPLLPPGEWTVTVHADGFATGQLKSVTVSTGETVAVV